MIAAASPRYGAAQWLCQQLGLLLEQLVHVVERQCRSERRNMLLINDAVVLGTAIDQANAWLPAAHLFKQPLQKLAKLLPALLQQQETTAQLRLLTHLYLLHQQLQPAPACVAAHHLLARKVASSVPMQLCQWLRDYQRREGAASTDLSSQLQAGLLQQAADQWRSNTLSPATLGKLLSEMQGLRQFSSSASSAEYFSQFAQQLALAHLAPTLVSDEEQLQCWETLWALVLRQQQLPLLGSNCEDIALLQAAQLDLNRWRPRIQHYLHQATAVPMLLSADILVLHYKLPWLLAAVGQVALARLYHCWYQLLLLCWKYKAPLSSALVSLLTQTTQVLQLQQWHSLTGVQIAHWQFCLLQLWPEQPDSKVQQVNLQAVSTAIATTVALNAVPVLLSRSFGKLSQCCAAWFADAEGWQLHRAALQQELLLLERGAAAVRIHEVEIFCSQLLALHHRLGDGIQVAEFPAQLLWRSYQHLLDLLDEAAAWQAPQMDLALVAALKRWLQDNSRDYPPALQSTNQSSIQSTIQSNMLREPSAPGPVSAQNLVQRLREFVDTMAMLIEQPLRFDVVIDPSVPDMLLQSCENALRPCLLALILEHAHASEYRREVLQPEATTIKVVISGNAKGAWIEINDDSDDDVSGQQLLRRLRNKLPAQVERLSCSTTKALGRRFYFQLAS